MKCNLQDAIEKLYKAFADVPKPKAIKGCPCCIEDINIDVLLSKPLKEISAKELNEYAGLFLNTVGDEADFQYFLPRMFELLILDSYWYPGKKSILGKLRLIRWQEWRRDRKTAIANFIESAFVSFVLRSGDGNFTFFHNDADIWLCAIACTGIAIEPLLKRIEQHPQTLVDLYEQNSKALIRGKLSSGFWQDVPDACQTVIDWFKSDEVTSIIDRQYSIIYGN